MVQINQTILDNPIYKQETFKTGIQRITKQVQNLPIWTPNDNSATKETIFTGVDK